MVDSEEQNIVLVQGIRLLSQKCPRLVKTCYWAGTSCIALEELHHRQSFDHDALLVVEMLMSSTDDAIRKDLVAYPDVRSRDAVLARNMLLEWLKEGTET